MGKRVNWRRYKAGPSGLTDLARLILCLHARSVRFLFDGFVIVQPSELFALRQSSG